jgi:hypothetical protein
MQEDLFLNVLAPALIPFLVGILANLIEGLAEKFSMRRRALRVAWDSAVLGVGLSGGVFSDMRVIQHYQPQGIGTAEFLCILPQLFCLIFMAYLRRENPEAGWKPTACLVLGGIALLLPVWLHAHALGWHWNLYGISL